MEQKKEIKIKSNQIEKLINIYYLYYFFLFKIEKLIIIYFYIY
jgi:hypothetical protein